MEELEEAVFELWWDAQLAWSVFTSLSTPWKFSMDGVAGIDDAVIIAVLELHPIKRKDRLQVFLEVQAILSGGLKYINEQKEKQRK